MNLVGLDSRGKELLSKFITFKPIFPGVESLQERLEMLTPFSYLA